MMRSKHLPLIQSGRAPSIASVIRGKIFEVDRMACQYSARTISAYRASVERTPWGGLPPVHQLTFKLAAISICHQINWDFLHARLAEHLLSSNQTEMVKRIAQVTAPELTGWLKGYAKPTRIRATERARMLRTIGECLSAQLAGDPYNLVAASHNRIAGPEGFVARLDMFEPYRVDPLRKKSNVLVQDLIRERIVAFEDQDSLRPAIDYHIVRLYLRSGRVVPLHGVVADSLKNKVRQRPRFVNALREAVAEALQLTAAYARLPLADVNYIEWQLGRSVCELNAPRCVGRERSSDLDADVANLFGGPCPYVAFCLARNDPEWRKLREPNFPTTFY